MQCWNVGTYRYVRASMLHNTAHAWAHDYDSMSFFRARICSAYTFIWQGKTNFAIVKIERWRLRKKVGDFLCCCFSRVQAIFKCLFSCLNHWLALRLSGRLKRCHYIYVLVVSIAAIYPKIDDSRVIQCVSPTPKSLKTYYQPCNGRDNAKNFELKCKGCQRPLGAFGVLRPSILDSQPIFKWWMYN